MYREIAQPNIVRQIPRIIILYILRRSRSMKFSKYLFLKYWKISRKNIIFIIQIMYCRIITCLLSCEFIFLNKVLFRYTLYFSSNQLNKSFTLAKRSKQQRRSNIVSKIYDWAFFAQSYSGPYFPAFGLNRERYFASLGIQSECGKIWICTWITPNMDTFYAMLIPEAYTDPLKHLKMKILGLSRWLVSKNILF